MAIAFPPTSGTNVRYGADWTFTRNFDAESFNKEHKTNFDETTSCPIDLEPLQGRAAIYHSNGGELHPVSSENFADWLSRAQKASCPGGCGKQIDSRDFGIISEFDQRLNIADLAFKVSVVTALIQAGLSWTSGVEPVSQFARTTLTTTLMALTGRINSHLARESRSNVFGHIALGFSVYAAGIWIVSTPVMMYDIAKLKPEFVAPLIDAAGTVATSVGNCISSVKNFLGW